MGCLSRLRFDSASTSFGGTDFPVCVYLERFGRIDSVEASFRFAFHRLLRVSSCLCLGRPCFVSRKINETERNEERTLSD